MKKDLEILQRKNISLPPSCLRSLAELCPSETPYHGGKMEPNTSESFILDQAAHGVAQTVNEGDERTSHKAGRWKAAKKKGVRGWMGGKRGKTVLKIRTKAECQAAATEVRGRPEREIKKNHLLHGLPLNTLNTLENRIKRQIQGLPLNTLENKSTRHTPCSSTWFSFFYLKWDLPHLSAFTGLYKAADKGKTYTSNLVLINH